MEKNKNSQSFSSSNSEEDHKNGIEKLLNTLPRKNSSGFPLCQYNGIWCPSSAIRGMISFQQFFQANQNDIILASLPKSDTTWLKALIFSIMNRNRYTIKDSPLLITHPHDLVFSVKYKLYRHGLPGNLDQLSQPRIFATHTHYASLPHSIIDSNCRIVYICRNPLDNFVSYWHFSHATKNVNIKPGPIDESFVNYCAGYHGFGPFWDNILGYWKASLEKPEKVLFMMYEDLKEDIEFEIKRLATFLGFSFTLKEEEEGLVEEISRLCSFEHLKSLEVNKNDVFNRGIPVTAYFRKGEVGDYANHLTPSMVEHLSKVIEEKFGNSGLVFKSN